MNLKNLWQLLFVRGVNIAPPVIADEEGIQTGEAIPRTEEIVKRKLDGLGAFGVTDVRRKMSAIWMFEKDEIECVEISEVLEQTLVEELSAEIISTCLKDLEKVSPANRLTFGPKVSKTAKLTNALSAELKNCDNPVLVVSATTLALIEIADKGGFFNPVLADDDSLGGLELAGTYDNVPIYLNRYAGADSENYILGRGWMTYKNVGIVREDILDYDKVGFNSGVRPLVDPSKVVVFTTEVEV